MFDNDFDDGQKKDRDGVPVVDSYAGSVGSVVCTKRGQLELAREHCHCP